MLANYLSSEDPLQNITNVEITALEDLDASGWKTGVSERVFSRTPIFYRECKNVFLGFSLSTIKEMTLTLDFTVEDVTTKNLETYKEYFITRLDKEITDFLLKHANEQIVNFILREQIVDPKELCAVLSWLGDKYAKKYGNFTLDIFLDPEEGFQFIEICCPKGNWEEWKNLSKEVKEEMRNAGMQDIASKVAIVCLEALQEQQS